MQPIFIPEYGLWFPGNEKRPDKTMSCLTKYEHDPDYAVSLIAKPQLNAVVQAGGHMGVWPLRFAAVFKTVHTFEPEPPCFSALLANTKAVKNINAYNVALGDADTMKMFRYWSSRTGVAAMAELATGGDLEKNVRVFPLDDYQLTDIALIYLDVEGYEPAILRGAVGTIRKYRPVVVCEMLARSADAIRAEMLAQGYFPIPNKFNPKCRDQAFMHRDDKRYRRAVQSS